MACSSYGFVGHVLPLAADVTMNREAFTIQTDSVDGIIHGVLDIAHSSITVIVQRPEPVRDVLILKARIQKWALIRTAAYGLAHGLGLDVEITRENCEEVTNLGV